MARVLVDAEIREINKALIPIIRKTGPFKIDLEEFAWSIMESSTERAEKIWELINYQGYAGEEEADYE